MLSSIDGVVAIGQSSRRCCHHNTIVSIIASIVAVVASIGAQHVQHRYGPATILSVVVIMTVAAVNRGKCCAPTITAMSVSSLLLFWRTARPPPIRIEHNKVNERQRISYSAHFSHSAVPASVLRSSCSLCLGLTMHLHDLLVDLASTGDRRASTGYRDRLAGLRLARRATGGLVYRDPPAFISDGHAYSPAGARGKRGGDRGRGTLLERERRKCHGSPISISNLQSPTRCSPCRTAACSQRRWPPPSMATLVARCASSASPAPMARPPRPS